jgi:hypothetical protein
LPADSGIALEQPIKHVHPSQISPGQRRTLSNVWRAGGGLDAYSRSGVRVALTAVEDPVQGADCRPRLRAARANIRGSYEATLCPAGRRSGGGICRSNRRPYCLAKPKPEAGPTVYVGELTPEQLKQLSDLGLDRSDISARQGATKNTTSVEVVLQRRQAAKLNSLGLKLEEKKSAAPRCRSDSTTKRQAATRFSAPIAKKAVFGMS